MKLYACVILLSTLAAGILGGTDEKNDDDRRLWSFVNSEHKTYVALHLLRGIVKLIFPDDQHKFPGIMYHVPSSSYENPSVALNATFLMQHNDDYLECRFGENAGLVAYVFENCEAKADNGILTDVKRNNQEMELSVCFLNGYAFSSYETGTSFMTLAVEGDLKCPAFFILPPSMKIESVPMKQADRFPLNHTEFPGDSSVWWKKSNDPKLPKQITFFDGNPTVNLLNTSKETSFSFRIGTNQVIPSFKLNFDGNTCSNANATLYLNELLSDECGVIIAPKPDGYEITTKGNLHNVSSLDSTRTLILMFVKSKVYIKVVENGETKSMQEYEICDVSNFEPADQFCLRAAFDGDDCTDASITLDSKDVQNGIEVLVAPVSAASGDDISHHNGTGDHDPASGEGTLTSNGDDTASAAMEPWIFIVIGVVLLFVLLAVAGILVYCCWFKKRRQAKNEKKSGNDVSQQHHVNNTNVRPRPPSPQGTRILSIELDKKSEDLKTAVQKPFKGDDLKSDIQKPIQTEPTQEDSGELPPGEPEHISYLIMRLHPENVNDAGIYGLDWNRDHDQPQDYHANEGPFKPTVNFANKKVCRVPPPAHYRNFWFCLGKLYHLKSNETPVFADEKRGHEVVNFIKRDMLLDYDIRIKRHIYAPFTQLANRILERGANDVRLNQMNDSYSKKLKPVYTLRVFIIHYEPVTIEVHCRGRCPLFVFEIFKECKNCKKILKELQESNWLTSSATYHEDWDTFLCRVKRTPCEAHQFLSFNDKDEPTNPELINHIFVIRGAFSAKETRLCTRNCSYFSKAHPNTYDIDQ